MDELRSLSDADVFSLLETVTRFALCRSEDDLIEAVSFSTKLLDFRWAAYSLGMLNDRAGATPVRIANISFPEEWARLYLSNCFHLIDPVYIENYRNFGVQVWGDTFRKSKGGSPFFRKKAEEFGLMNGYSLGAKNFKGTIGTLFSISGGSLAYDSREMSILSILLPHIHEALLRIAEPAVRDYQARTKRPLSRREKELLVLAKTGMGTAEIRKAMGITERTVDFHVSNILRKLDASSRTHAVAIALKQGLLERDG